MPKKRWNEVARNNSNSYHVEIRSSVLQRVVIKNGLAYILLLYPAFRGFLDFRVGILRDIAHRNV